MDNHWRVVHPTREPPELHGFAEKGPAPGQGRAGLGVWGLEQRVWIASVRRLRDVLGNSDRPFHLYSKAQALLHFRGSVRTKLTLLQQTLLLVTIPTTSLRRLTVTTNIIVGYYSNN
ncbi:hypothetical protein Sjap_011419 [Stephania japonica]|uniref:Uncharacterized protein n=1 Tax=Stephania japonica TaxID=461633 RepID=A0AAP0JB26_9MAGN